MKKFLKSIYLAIVYIFCKLFGFLLYDKVYMQGVDFDRWDSKGWMRIWHSWFPQKIIGINRHAPWPVTWRSRIGVPENIIIHPNSLKALLSPGLYIQGIGAKVFIGKEVYIAPNVGIITSNHDSSDPNQHLKGKDVIIGDQCWIGMNSVILPGVTLGDHTIVGAGSIVTKSFPQGNCVIAGNPAKLIRNIGE